MTNAPTCLRFTFENKHFGFGIAASSENRSVRFDFNEIKRHICYNRDTISTRTEAISGTFNF